MNQLVYNRQKFLGTLKTKVTSAFHKKKENFSNNWRTICYYKEIFYATKQRLV